MVFLTIVRHRRGRKLVRWVDREAVAQEVCDAWRDRVLPAREGGMVARMAVAARETCGGDCLARGAGELHDVAPPASGSRGEVEALWFGQGSQLGDAEAIGVEEDFLEDQPPAGFECLVQ